MKLQKLIFSLMMVILSLGVASGQGVGINGTGSTPDPAAGLDVDFPDKGFLPPRMTTAQRNAISNPPAGLQIYNTDTECLNMWNGGTWRQSCFECDFNAPTVGNNGPLCEGSNLNLTATLVSGATYNWTGPNAFTSTQQNPSISNVTTAADGVYSLQVTLNGCTSSPVTTVVTVNSTPQTPVAGNNGPVCESDAINLTASSIVGALFSWSGPNGYSSTQQNPVINSATLAHAGTYTVFATVNGCASASASTTLTVNATPATPTAGSNSPACEGNAINLTAATVSGATYSWTGPNAFSSSQQNPSISNVNSSHAGTYTVTATVNGCVSASSSATVQVLSTLGQTQTFSYTGSQQTFSVPSGACKINIEAWGAEGGNGAGSSTIPAGKGGYATGDLIASPGATLYIYVGGQGGFNGGGDGGTGTNNGGLGGPAGKGGGASDVRMGGNALTDRMIVAGGGGGGGRSYYNGGYCCGVAGGGGAGGGAIGTAGSNGGTQSGDPGKGGDGGNQTGGGTGGLPGSGGINGGNGSLGQGGTGANGGYNVAGGGGGGGYYGGGGGGGAGVGSGGAGGGGGGGSSYTGGVSNGSTTPNLRSGNGQIILSW